ncbi:MAG: diguanylate cyclase [bacterium]|nr:diguanylate cyclase [bacterium]
MLVAPRPLTSHTYCSQLLFRLTVFIFGVASNVAVASLPDDAISVFWDKDIGSVVLAGIAQGPSGFLWVGTQAGLVRYDGYRFVTLRHDGTDSSSLDDDYTRTVYISSDGRIWVGTLVGVNLFQPKTGSFVRYSTQSPGQMAYVGVASITEHGGTILVAADAGLFQLDHERRTIVPFRDGAVAWPSSEPVGFVISGRDRTLWVGARHALYALCPNDDEFRMVIRAGGDEGIVGLFEERTGRIWARWSNGALDVVDAASDEVTRVRGAGPELGGFSASWEGIVQPTDDEIWIGTNSGVLVLDSVSGEQKRSMPLAGPAQSLFIDASGVIWLGISGRGLGRYVPHPAVSLIRDGLSIPSVGSAAEVDGRMWVGTRGGGIHILNADGTHVQDLDIAAMTGPANDGFVREILPLGDSVWVATGVTGVLRLDRKGKLLGHFSVADGLPSNRTFSLANDSVGRIWIGTIDGGLGRIDPRDGTVERISWFSKNADGVYFPILDIAVDASNIMYFGTEGGLWRITPDGEATQFQYDAADATSISHNGVVRVLLDSQGRLWAGTRGGLNLMLPRPDGSASFRRFGTQHGWRVTFTDGLLEGARGDIWVATTGFGLVRLSCDAFEMTVFDGADGVPDSGFFVAGHGKRSDGTLMFAAKEGLLTVAPDIAKWTFRPPVVVTEVRVAGRTLEGEGWRDLVLEPAHRDFSVEFAALDLSAPDENLYSYRLEGYDEEWIDTDADRRIATYTNLDPGVYTLRVRGSNRSGIWSEDELAVPITIRSALYERRWFHVAFALMALFLFYLTFVWRVRSIHKRKQELEELVRQRTLDLEEAKSRFERSSKTDYLTRLPNRRAFIEVARREISRCARAEQAACIALCDIDRFKLFNDMYGHDAGDFVLQSVGRFFEEQIRASDIVARWGGEEFIYLLPDTDLSGGHTLAEKVREQLAMQRWTFGGNEFEITVTFGVCQIDDEFEACLKRADGALYRGKSEGGNRVVSAAPEGVR